MGTRETVTRENTKKQEDESHSVESITPQGEWLACRYLNRLASNRPASRLQAPHKQTRPRLSISRLASARASAPVAGLSLAGGRGTATSQRPRRLGLGPAARLWRRGRLGAWDGPTLHKRGRVSAQERRDPLGPSFCAPIRGASTSPQGGPSRIRSRRDAIPSESSLSSPPSPPSSSLGDSSSGSPLCLDFARRPLVLGGRGSLSSPSSFLSPLRTSASQRTGAACRGRPRPPSLEALRTERRSVPARAKTSLKRDRRKPRIEAIYRKGAYQIN